METKIKSAILLLVGISIIHIVVEGLYSLLGYGNFEYNLRDFIIYLIISIIYGFWPDK